jgi:heme oxygenase
MELPAATPSRLRARLRVATGAAHNRVEALAARLDLSDRRGYARFIAAHAAVLIPLEQMLAEQGVTKILADWPRRTRSAALMRDLDTLHTELWAIPVPVFSTEAEMLGTLYVLEGSRLDARHILRQLGNDAAPGATHYLSHGTPELWPAFLSVLENSRNVQEDFASVVDAALSTFEMFERAIGLDLEMAA